MLEVLFEFILQIFAEVLADLFRWGLKETPHPVISAICYFLLGAIFGGLSLLIWPNSFLHATPARVTNLVVAPIVSGGIFAAIGQWRMRRGRRPVPLEKFANGFLFALSFGIVRFAFAT